MTKDSAEKSKELIREETYKEIVTNELERIGSGGAFVWTLFFLCVTPNILNGFHVSSYTLLGYLPADKWCNVPELGSTNWTLEEKRTIVEGNTTTNGCTIKDWNYELLSTKTYDEARIYTMEMLASDQPPKEIECNKKGGFIEFDEPDGTFVAEWELVCDRSIQRTSAQMFVSLGKFFGSFTFGILADKFGRKTSFSLGALVYVVSSFICTFTPWYNLFLVGRFGLGAASSGLFYAAFTMIVENVCLKHRSWMSIAFAASYPIGMIFLAIASYLITSWRYLQLTLSVPALLLIFNCYLLNESPRWLITKKRYAQAYKIIFKQRSHYEIEKTDEIISTNTKKEMMEKKPTSLWVKIQEGPLKQFIALFATWKVRKLILTSYFMFCVSSLSYYVTALNAANLSVSRYLYVAITGIVDIPSYILPIILLKYNGRRPTTMFLFILTGTALLLVLVMPSDWIISFAMLGRFGISATYSIVTLYTAELYPTEIRNSALGTCSTWAHVGSISAPYIVDILGQLGWYIPTTICGCCVFVAGLLTINLPETSTVKLSDRIEEVPSESDNTTINTSGKKSENDKY
ncbi:organic cation transporter protein [Teleopsis dalmanni]|uniref:organic cation transporter protein n=1 Tax=Teleopsis dalmanni TaxID=139649 RepID=UPI0018CCE317|nr:organic cation transporter protein [Teleopsis dalmanni]